MLRLGAEAGTVDLNGRGAPDGPLEEWERRCRAGVTDPDGRVRQEIGFLMLFRDGPQGYLPLGSPLDGPQSGECRRKGDPSMRRTMLAGELSLGSLPTFPASVAQ